MGKKGKEWSPKTGDSFLRDQKHVQESFWQLLHGALQLGELGHIFNCATLFNHLGSF